MPPSTCWSRSGWPPSRSEEVEAGHYVYHLEPDWPAIRARLAEAAAQADRETADWLQRGADVYRRDASARRRRGVRTIPGRGIMEKFVIQGGIPLNGTVVPSGNKNAALPILAATLLTDQPVTLHNLPNIGDVQTMLTLLEDLGASGPAPQQALGDDPRRRAVLHLPRSRAVQPDPGLADPDGADAGPRRADHADPARRRPDRPAADRHPPAGPGGAGRQGQTQRPL